MLIVDGALLLVFSVVLWKATEVLLSSLNFFSRLTHLNKFGLAAMIVATATSAPELLVSVTGAVAGEPSLALGNVLGSNIANVSLVIGGAALVGGSLGVVGEFVKRDFFVGFLAAALPLVLLVDGSLSRIEGVALIAVYVIFSVGVLGGEHPYGGRIHHGPSVRRMLQIMGKRRMEKELVWLVVALGLMVVAAWVLVGVIHRFTQGLGLPIFFGGLLLAIGTTLPELVFEIEAIRKKEAGMVFGNLLGSLAANSMLILGLVAVIAPIQMWEKRGLGAYLLGTLVFIFVFSLFWVFVKTKRRLERWEGAILLMVYGVFLLVELIGIA